MKGMLPYLLFRPDAFFSERMKEPEDLKIPGIIVVIGGITSAVTAYLMSGVYSGLISAAVGEGMVSMMGAFSALSAFFAFLILWWLIFAGIFYLLSMAFAGNGTFRRTLEFTGYGLVPVIIGLIISTIVSLYYIPLVEVPVITNIQDPAAVQRFMSDILMDPAFREFTWISAVISLLFLAWSANLWIFGIRHARNLIVRNAAIVVLIPVAIFTIYTLYTTFVGMLFMGGP